MSVSATEVLEASEEDIVESVVDMLRYCGKSLSELRTMAATGRFDTLQSRLAWVVVGGYPGDLPDGTEF